MAGARNSVKPGRGKHFSRRGVRASFDEGARELKAVLALHLGAIEQADFELILVAVAHVRVGRDLASRGRDRPTRDDAMATLTAMLKLKDDDALKLALHQCDVLTFNAICAASVAIAADEISVHGVFVDEEGNEWRLHPPGISLYPGLGTYLPMGVPGLRMALESALKAVEGRKGSAGNNCKPYMPDLADACRLMWEKYRPVASQRAWVNKVNRNKSPIQHFAEAVFGVAGAGIAPSRVEELMQKKTGK